MQRPAVQIAQIPSKGKVIIHNLNEVLTQMLRYTTIPFSVMVTYWVSYLVSKGSTKRHQITQNCIGGSFTAAHPMQLKC